MKLLVCLECTDVFKLDYEPRACKCGAVTGRYVNNLEAVTNGRGVSMAIGNGSLVQALNNLNATGAERLSREDAIEAFRVLCWVRPNDGTGNPHTKVVGKDGE